MAKEFDRKGLQKFVDSNEGDPPPVFVGRQETIEDILKTAKGGYQPGASRHGSPKATRVIHGAPGAGKSSILSELDRQCRVLAATDENAPRVVSLYSQELVSDLPDVLKAITIAGCSKKKQWFEISKEYGKRILETVRYDYEGLSINPSDFFGKLELNGISDMPKKYPPSSWNVPVIVAIDEAQRLPPGDDTPQAGFLQNIHDNVHGLPLTLVLAGLGDTFDRARKAGLTRGLTPHEIGCLTKEEYRELTRRFCGHYGMSGYTEAQLARLSGPTEGWPRHLHFAFQALGEQALRVDGDLRRADWDGTILEAAKGRLGYYHGQRSPEMKASANLVKAVMTGLEDRMDASDIDRLIERSVADEAGMQLPEVGPDDNLRYMRPREFRQHLVHNGALEQRMDGTYHCPIPSNRRFLMMKGDLTAQQLMTAATA